MTPKKISVFTVSLQQNIFWVASRRRAALASSQPNQKTKANVNAVKLLHSAQSFSMASRVTWGNRDLNGDQSVRYFVFVLSLGFVLSNAVVSSDAAVIFTQFPFLLLLFTSRNVNLFLKHPGGPKSACTNSMSDLHHTKQQPRHHVPSKDLI
jgi:hypothetical protein